MEPSPGLKRIILTGVVLAVVVALSACRRSVDVPAQTTSPQPVPATAQLTERTPSDAEAQLPPPDAGPQLQPSGSEARFPPSEEEATETGAAEATQGPDPLQSSPAAEEEAQSEPQLPPPLVDDPDSLQPLHPFYPVWIDRHRTHVVMVGRVCQRRAPLELFACLKGSKEHESVVVIDTKAYVVHAGLLAVGAEPGSPVTFVPEYVAASGPEIEITVIWQDEKGRRRRVRAQDWVRDVAGLYTMFQGVTANQFDDELNLGDQFAAWKEMDHPWVFAGSRFVEDSRTGERYYQADAEGELICVSNFPSAVLDVPIRSSDSNAALLFEAFTERIPPLGTPVTLILTPKLGN